MLGKLIYLSKCCLLSTARLQEFELEYNPSNWVLRLPAENAVSHHVEIVTKGMGNYI